MLAVRYGEAVVFLPGTFGDQHVLRALGHGRALRPLKEGHMRKARAFQQAINEMAKKNYVHAVSPPPCSPQDGHALFKAHGESWQELWCGNQYAHLLSRTVELHNAQLCATQRRLTVSSFKKNLNEFAIEMNEKAGVLRFNP